LTLDRVPEELYPEIATNDAQREEWVRLFAIDEIKKDLSKPGYSKPLEVEFLKANQNLVLDTAFFTSDFTLRLLRGVDSLDKSLSGVLVHAENMSGLSLLMTRFRGKVETVYADPPYNTDGSPIMYKNGLKNSTWVSMIYDRLALCRMLLTPKGMLCATIDDAQQRELHYTIGNIFGEENIAGTVIIRANPSGRPIPTGFGIAHEYAVFARNSPAGIIGKMPRTEAQLSRYSESDQHGKFMWELFRKRGSGSERADRPTMYYPLFSRGGIVRVPAMAWDEEERVWVLEEKPGAGETVHYPIDSEGVHRRWRWKSESVAEDVTQFKVALNREGEAIVYYKYRPDEEGVIPLTVWADAKYSATEHGTGVLKKFFTEYKVFDFPKSVFAVEDCLHISGLHGEATCVDCFAGSGTTGHAAINLNRRDGGNRRFILLEMGSHFDSVLRPRIEKLLYSDSWDDGKPKERKAAGSFCVKYLRLESYEDALNNLELNRTTQQGTYLDADAEMREQYILSYMLDVDSRGSQSLLNVEAFRNPDEYKLRVERNGETQLVNVDLVETFNWLLGLTVKHIDVIRGVRVVEGTAPNGDRVLVLWRNIDQMDNDALDKWFEKQEYNTREMVYDVFYVNGDNNLENLRRPDQTWKVRMIEEEFQRLMFSGTE
jgi:adenine-specific DNA-methyltransferase